MKVIDIEKALTELQELRNESINYDEKLGLSIAITTLKSFPTIDVDVSEEESAL